MKSSEIDQYDQSTYSTEMEVNPGWFNVVINNTLVGHVERGTGGTWFAYDTALNSVWDGSLAFASFEAAVAAVRERV